MTIVSDEFRGRLATELGDTLTPQWRPAYDAVPRECFIPDTTPSSDNYPDLDRATDPQGWLEQVYANRPITTKTDEHGRSISSCSMPLMVFTMLTALDVTEGMTVLEIGTGTGWNAGLLAHRLGPERVTSIEIDPQVAQVARTNLAHLSGPAPTLVVGDGEQGWAQGAPYDRLIATCAVTRVPHAWVAQVKPGGMILTPFGTAFRNEGLLKLTVHDDGTASGPIIDTAAFMWLRAQQPPTVDEPDDFEQQATTSHNRLTVADDIEVFGGAAAFTIGVRVPGCRTISYADDEGYAATRWLLSADSWACLSFADGTVRQLGPRRLWDEVETAHQWWIDHDRPEITRFGVTISAESQTIWLDDPSQVVG